MKPVTIDKKKLIFYRTRKSYLKFLKKFVPCLKNIAHDSIAITLGSLMIGVFLIIFIYFFVKNYQLQRTTYFLEIGSFDENNNAINEPNCDLIPLSISGTFMATNDGYWEGGSNFQYANAAYKLKVVNYKKTYTTYYDDMKDIYSQLSIDGNYTISQNLGYNILFWMTKTYLIDNEQSYRFSLDGSVLRVLNRDFTKGSIISSKGICTLSTTTTFLPSTGQISMAYNYDDFVENPTCYAAVDPVQLNYDSVSIGSTFTPQFDVRSLVTAVSINLRINLLSTLIEIPVYRTNITQINSYSSKYYDPKYPGMDPINCITAYNTSSFVDGFSLDVCYVTIGKVHALPIFHHSGANMEGQYCDCSKLSEANLNSSKHFCNQFKFLSGFIFWSVPSFLDTDDYTTVGSFSAIAIHKFAEKYWRKSTKYGLYYANRDAYDAAFMGSAFNGQQKTFFSSAFDFCKLDGYVDSCSMLVFTSFDVDQKTYSISDNYYQLMTGACQDTVSPTAEQWKTLTSKSFTSLTQNYQECVYDVFDSMVNGVCISKGVASLLFPLVAALLIKISIVIMGALKLKHRNEDFVNHHYNKHNDEFVNDDNHNDYKTVTTDEEKRFLHYFARKIIMKGKHNLIHRVYKSAEEDSAFLNTIALAMNDFEYNRDGQDELEANNNSSLQSDDEDKEDDDVSTIGDDHMKHNNDSIEDGLHSSSYETTQQFKSHHTGGYSNRSSATVVPL
eukprot:gene5984-8241_t